MRRFSVLLLLAVSISASSEVWTWRLKAYCKAPVEMCFWLKFSKEEHCIYDWYLLRRGFLDDRATLDAAGFDTHRSVYSGDWSPHTSTLRIEPDNIEWIEEKLTRGRSKFYYHNEIMELTR